MVDASNVPDTPPRPADDSTGQFLCLTICGYRRPGMNETDYRNHMTQVSAPMTADLMVKYGIKRWTMIHNTAESRALMSQLFDRQMANLADFDCFSQVVFKSLADYKRLKEDPWYREHLVGDHEKFADTRRSIMTIGRVTEIVHDGKVVNCIARPTTVLLRHPLHISSIKAEATAVMTGSFLAGAMMSLSLIAVPALLDSTHEAPQLFYQWTRIYHYGHWVLPSMAVVTSILYGYAAAQQRRRQKKTWISFALAAVMTVSILPFTWLFMVPTNDELFRLQTISQTEPAVMGIDAAKALVVRWRDMHSLRSLFPLIGSILGTVASVGR
ncbi:hypothetical protein Aspvir_010195 [Aspergillus viridinutans]|uniref:EthD domain-containing protein n=1 Tax=Aspergillus viridinutans TaxID=75553 RepID=A0A9P3C567_ASPVI|nr:uncharacterized protein Aspvir_010195 [Aspergillus viridinutans]GIK06077.1 hypothetical protein Aspvir_010195 [Aspergillus viridinutans]